MFHGLYPTVDFLDEIQIGPFDSWANVRSDFGAVGNGRKDDTAAIQHALNELGTNNKVQVLYIPAGIYKISKTLYLNGSPLNGPHSFGWGGVSIRGENASSTILKWFGKPSDPMLVQNGGYGTLYQNITWDGSSTAGYGVAQWWDALGGRLYGGATIHQDEVFQDMRIGIMAGRLGTHFGQLDSEGKIERVTFLRNSYAGFDVGSWNALNWWVWNSHFVDCARGVTNEFSIDDNGPTAGAGGFNIYKSLFERSTIADVRIGNTGWFSLKGNISVGSRQFFEALPAGENSAVMILQANRIVRTTAKVPISVGNLGPLFLIDNEIQGQEFAFQLTDWIFSRDVLSIGNHLSAPLAKPLGFDRILSIDDKFIPDSSINVKPSALSTLALRKKRRIVEVPVGASRDKIQSLFDESKRSLDPEPVIHFGSGNWIIDGTIKVPPGKSYQIVGDGFGSTLSASNHAKNRTLFDVYGRSRILFRDLQLLTSESKSLNSMPAIRVLDADQDRGRVQIGSSAVGRLLATNLRRTRIWLKANPSIAAISLNDVSSAMSIGTGGVGPIRLNGGGNFIMEDSWYEGTETALFRMSDGTFTYLGGTVAPANRPGAVNPSEPPILIDKFQGQASWIGVEFDLRGSPQGIGARINCNGENAGIYLIGTTSNRPNYLRAECNEPRTKKVGFILNRTVQGATHIQVPNWGATSIEDIKAAWEQARNVDWHSTTSEIPNGTTDIRIYHVKMDQTGGISLLSDVAKDLQP